MKQLSRETGVSVDTLRTLRGAAEHLGVDGDTITQGVSALAGKMVDLRRNHGDLFDSLRVGTGMPGVLAQIKADGDDADAVLGHLLGGLQKIKGVSDADTEQLRKQWSAKIFDTPELAKLFSRGPERLQEEIANARRRVGQTPSDDLEKQGDLLGRNLKAFNDELERFTRNVGPPLLMVMTKVLEAGGWVADLGRSARGVTDRLGITTPRAGDVGDAHRIETKTPVVADGSPGRIERKPISGTETPSVTDSATSTTTGIGRPKMAGSGTGVDPRLTDILRQASSSLPDGYSAKIISGLRPGDPRFHGKGMAEDVAIYDPAGRKLGNYQNDETFRIYEQLAQSAKKIQLDQHPELSKVFRWGGYFSGPKGKYGAVDTMHFDLGGSAMGGGSWADGLTPAQRRMFPGAISIGMRDLRKQADEGADILSRATRNNVTVKHDGGAKLLIQMQGATAGTKASVTEMSGIIKDTQVQRGRMMSPSDAE